MILVSACLLGINCKYNGDNNLNETILGYLKYKEFILVCPEQLGGMTTPRLPCEIIEYDGDYVIEGKGKVFNIDNLDVTENFIKGANEALKIAKLYGCNKAILKEGSPSCGSKFIYDGSFSNVKKQGIGVTTALLKKNNIEVISEKDI